MTAVTTIERNPGFIGILRDDQQFATGASAGAAESINGSFDRLMVQSGLQTAPAVWLGLCAVTGLAFGGGAWVASENLLLAGILGLAGMMLPIVVAMVLRGRRQKKIMDQLPPMAEELARAARTGRSVENAFQIVAADTPAPLGDELKRVARQTDMGLDLASAARDLAERTGVMTLTMFSSALSVHQDTGGDLIQVLERLAVAVRDRLHFMSRLRAATVASRLGTFLMILIPVLVLVFYAFRDPGYFTQLFQSFWGRLSLGIAVVLQVIGCVTAWQILKRSARF